jgi:hypothetical protein
MYYLKVDEEWNQIDPSDLWVYNKLFLSRVLGYKCGPAGSTVPKPDFYIVRPSFNLFGMSRFSRKEWINKETDDMHPAEFWCEIFEGEHLSVDYHHKQQNLVILGTKNDDDPIYKWRKWEKIDRTIDFPEVLNKLKDDYEWINCEFIDGHLIEVQFRRNPNFRYENSVAVPVWDENIKEILDGYRFIEDESYERRGFWVK